VGFCIRFFLVSFAGLYLSPFCFRKIEQRQNLSRLKTYEQMWLILATLTVFFSAVCLNGERIHSFLFPEPLPPNTTATIYCCLADQLFIYFISFGFLFTFLGALLFSLAGLAFKRVLLARTLFLPSLIFAVTDSFQQLHYTNIRAEALEWIIADNPFFPFHYQELLLFAFLIFLVLWHTKILIQDSARLNKLP
jgi:hypothetical protein